MRIARRCKSFIRKQTNLLPRGSLFVRPDAGDVERVTRSFVRDISRLADEQRARYARTCGIVLDHEICGCVLGVSSVSCQGCHNYSVLQGYRAELDGLEEFGGGHCKGGVLERFAGCRFPHIQSSFIEQFAEVDDHSSLSGIIGLRREVGE